VDRHLLPPIASSSFGSSDRIEGSGFGPASLLAPPSASKPDALLGRCRFVVNPDELDPSYDPEQSGVGAVPFRMKPSPFRYLKPESLEETLGYLDEWGSECVPLAGGQSLVPLMNFRVARPEALIDLDGLDELRGIEVDDRGLRIGAMTRQCEIEFSEELSAAVPLLVEATPLIGHFQIRSRGTIGGSVAHADPAAEYPTVLVALAGSVLLTSRAGRRELPAEAFFRGPFVTAREPGELVTAVRFPTQSSGRRGVAFLEFTRCHRGLALAGVAATVSIGGDGTIEEARLALAGVGPCPIRVAAAADLRGQLPVEEVFEELAGEVRRTVEPGEDAHGSAEFRRHLVATLVVRALGRATKRALDGEEGG
jgi:CO/xanthine dehydrogenase FAD-binding subunit